MLVVSQIGEKREFTGNDGSKITACDIVLTDGTNTFVASAFDKVQQKIAETPLQVGTVINANLSFFLTKVNSEKGEFFSQKVRLESFGIMILPS